MIDMATLLVQDKEPIATTVDDEVVMLSARAGAYFGLNGVGSDIWNMLRQPRRVGDLCAALASQYQIDDNSLQRDVIWFLEEMIERGLLRVVEDRQAET